MLDGGFLMVGGDLQRSCIGRSRAPERSPKLLGNGFHRKFQSLRPPVHHGQRACKTDEKVIPAAWMLYPKTGAADGTSTKATPSVSDIQFWEGEVRYFSRYFGRGGKTVVLCCILWLRGSIFFFFFTLP